jgi:putative ABC transport system ATP-binding protein
MERNNMTSFTVENPIIKAQDITKEVTFNGSKLSILSKVNLSIKRGESVAIMGPSGAGKTTLLGILAGLDTPDSGAVIIDGVDIVKLDEEGRTKLRAKNIGFIFQNFYLLDNLTALENVMLPLQLRYDVDAKQKAINMLSAVGLNDRIDHQPRQLSGGEQQRVAIARAFVTKPIILFADEPTGNLDQATGDIIIEQLFAMNKEFATTLVIITHEITLAKRCDRIIHLMRGEIN